MAIVLLTLLSVPAYAPSPQPADRELLRIFITADANQPYKGVKQRLSQLEETVRDVRGSFEGSKWLEVVEVEQAADVRLRILGRRKTVDQKFAIGYSLEAADFDTEDEYLNRANRPRQAGAPCPSIGESGWRPGVARIKLARRREKPCRVGRKVH